MNVEEIKNMSNDELEQLQSEIKTELHNRTLGFRQRIKRGTIMELAMAKKGKTLYGIVMDVTCGAVDMVVVPDCRYYAKWDKVHLTSEMSIGMNELSESSWNIIGYLPDLSEQYDAIVATLGKTYHDDAIKMIRAYKKQQKKAGDEK